MTIRLSGVGSGIDIDSLIDGLVQASSGRLSSLQTKASRVNSAITSVSEIGTLLTSLEAAAKALSTQDAVGSFAATSNNEAIVASAGENAVAGTYQVTVDRLARAERTYSNVLASSLDQALDYTGQLTLQIGTGDLVDPEGTLLVGGATLGIQIDPSDTLQSVVNKINSGDLRLRASTFYDGSGYRIQVSGLDVGAENDVIFDEGGMNFGFNQVTNTKQAAQDALVYVDGFAVTSKDNKIAGAIQGVTLALTKETTDPVQITVDSDTKALSGKVDAFVKAYNAVVQNVHVQTGFGSTRAVNPALAADPTLRGVLGRLGGVLSTISGTGKYNTLASVGLSLSNNGSINFDSSKLNTALAADLRSVQKLFAGEDTPSGSQGIMDLLTTLSDQLSAPGGTIAIKREAMRSQVRGVEESVTREQRMLDQMAEQLRRTFTLMDSTVAANQSQLQYLLSSLG